MPVHQSPATVNNLSQDNVTHKTSCAGAHGQTTEGSVHIPLFLPASRRWADNVHAVNIQESLKGTAGSTGSHAGAGNASRRQQCGAANATSTAAPKGYRQNSKHRQPCGAGNATRSQQCGAGTATSTLKRCTAAGSTGSHAGLQTQPVRCAQRVQEWIKTFLTY